MAMPYCPGLLVRQPCYRCCEYPHLARVCRVGRCLRNNVGGGLLGVVNLEIVPRDLIIVIDEYLIRLNQSRGIGVIVHGNRHERLPGPGHEFYVVDHSLCGGMGACVPPVEGVWIEISVL